MNIILPPAAGRVAVPFLCEHASDVFSPSRCSKAKNVTGAATARLPEPDALVQNIAQPEGYVAERKAGDSIMPRLNDRADISRWSSAKRVGVYSTFGASLVALGLGVFSAAKYLSAQSELDKGTFRYGDCTTQADCARLKELSDDQHAWFQRTVALSFTSLGLVAGGTVLGLVLPNGTTIAPTASASRDGANLTLSGTF